MKPRLVITCPIYVTNWNHRDFLDRTTRSIAVSEPYLWIPVFNRVDPQFRPYIWQWVQHPSAIEVVEGRQPQCVAKGWNDGIARAIELGAEYILVINDDIVLKSNAIDNLLAFAQSHPEAILWTMGAYHDLYTLEQAVDRPDDFHEHPHFSAFMVHRSFVRSFGRFDENFQPGYMEDCDAAARIALANQKAYVTAGAWFFHFGSRTMGVDEELRSYNASLGPRNSTYFVQKWGHGLVNEVDQMRQVYFKTPYNEPDRPLSYWRPAP